MPINPDAVGTKSDPHTVSWTPRDCVIYALGVGAGTGELEFSTWDTASQPQQVLPTFAVVAGGGKVGTTEGGGGGKGQRSEEHTSELQSIMRSSYDVF